MNICINVPSVVYSNSWLAQTTGFSSSIFTIPSDGQYRVSIGLLAEGNSGSTNVTAVVTYPVPTTGSASWTQLLANAITGFPSVPNVSAGAVGSFVGVSGQIVPVSVTISGGSINHYDLYVTIEQLQ